MITATSELTLYLDGTEVFDSVHQTDFANKKPAVISLPVGVGVIAVNVTPPDDESSPMFMVSDSLGLLRDSSWRCVTGHVTSNWMRPEVDCSSWPEADDLGTNSGSVSHFADDDIWFGVYTSPGERVDNTFCRMDVCKQI